MSLIIIGLIGSLGAQAGWTQTDQDNDCTFYIGERQGDFAPVRAVCDWPIAPDKLQGLIAKLDDHDLYFGSVAKADKHADGVYIQQHQAVGISNREIVLDMGSTPIDGGINYWWKKSADQSALSGDNVEPAADTGKWEITAGASGGSHVVYELLYDPGGSVPGFLVRWFQGAGTQELVGELRSYAESH